MLAENKKKNRLPVSEDLFMLLKNTKIRSSDIMEGGRKKKNNFTFLFLGRFSCHSTPEPN
jgi:hypothetical protein